MIFERITLSVNSHDFYLDAYVADRRTFARDAVLILPGGAYRDVCDDREGETIALAYLGKGLNAFVLHYSVGEKYQYPSHLTEASLAMIYLKSHADELCINKDRIFAVGFSAGGHLAGSLAILHKEPKVLDALKIANGDNRPCGAVLSYPVVSAICDTHEESFCYLSGKAFGELSEDEKKALSLECNVDEDSAPAFIWHTAEDALVPVVGSLRLAEAYYRAKRPFSLRVYPYGPHGVALANDITAGENGSMTAPLAEEWVDASIKWMKTVK